jgi:membrane-associated phospholipid phosphatase
MKQLKSFIYKLKAYDLVVVIFFLFLTTLHLIYNERIPEWKFFVPVNIGIIFFAFLLAWLEYRFEHKIFRVVHYWYILPLILFTFKQLYYMIKPIRQQDYDYLFIAIDRWMFGTDPTVFMYRFAHPVLTEILQIVYGLFYLLPIILILVLLKNKRYLAVDFAIFCVIYGFYLSYLGYFTLPGIGPRFTLHDFGAIDTELPGLWLTTYLREFTNIGESIPSGTADPAFTVQRDIFPSGHTMITLIVMYLSVKLKSRSRYFLIPTGTLLIFSTVYLRYHYVIDLIGAFVFMVFAIWTGKLIFNWWRSKTGAEQFEYWKV